MRHAILPTHQSIHCMRHRHQVIVIALAHSKSNPDQPTAWTFMDLAGTGAVGAQADGASSSSRIRSPAPSPRSSPAPTMSARISHGRRPGPWPGLQRQRHALRRQLPFSVGHVYAIDDGKRIASIHVGDGPAALAFSATATCFLSLIRASGDVAVVRTSSNSCYALLPAKAQRIAVKAFKVP